MQLAPHRPVSGGKPLQKPRPKAKGTRTAEALRKAAVALRNSRSALGARDRRIAHRLGPAVAVFVTARQLGTLVYRMLRWGQPYVDIGPQAYEEQHRAAKLRALASTAAQLGYHLVKQSEALPA